MPFRQDQLGLDHFSASGKVERELRREISAATGLVERRGKSHLQTVFLKIWRCLFVGVTVRIWVERRHKEQYPYNTMQLLALHSHQRAALAQQLLQHSGSLAKKRSAGKLHYPQ